jgi:hypothetical protein
MKIQDLIKVLTDMAGAEEAAAAPEEKQETMVSPLQQELELLKKATGVESMYDDCEEEELTIIKKNAGIPVQQIQRGEI